MKRLSQLLLIASLVVHAYESTPSEGQRASSDPGEGIVTHSDSLATDLSNPVGPGSTWIPEESAAHQAAWETVHVQCDPVETGEDFSSSCYVALTAYFSDQPVWVYSNLRYFDSLRGMKLLYVRDMNYRPMMLPYSFADYAIEEVPFWRDIFERRVSQRQERFEQVMQDEDCKNLVGRQDLGIREQLADQCYAREVYKYATHLDACATAYQRLEVLDAVDEQYVRVGKHSTYDMSVYFIENYISDFELRSLVLERLQRGYLHAH